MSDMRSRIYGDEQEYRRLCDQYGEKWVDLYSSHHHELEARQRAEWDQAVPKPAEPESILD
jgi:hypothetical protein